jgi:diguanylate cyclase (GGDEF)-like protein
MNIAMASLSVQLVLYAVAWLLLGHTFRLRRSVAILWSSAWFAGACCTLLVFVSATYTTVNLDLVVNTLVLCCFLLIQQGLDLFTGRQSPRWMYAGLLGCVALIEALRQAGPTWIVWQVALFTLIACWPLAATLVRMAVWLRTERKSSIGLVILVVSPLIVTMALFLVRLLLVVRGVTPGTVQFSQGSDFDVLATILFLLMLGAFNFSLATIILGGTIERLRTMSETDQLTGLFNRRVMMRRLHEEHARFLRSGHRYGVISLDLDHFKRVNDEFGHGVGDQVLRAVSDILKSCQRNTDTLARMGGEEFMLLVPLTEEAGAEIQAQRICTAIGETDLKTDAGSLRMTMSIGVAIVLAADTSVKTVIDRSDVALYRAKEAGRNRVELASDASIH